MITFHSIVRGFEDEFDIIQRNAISSWLKLEPHPEVLLFGNEDHEPGAIEAALDFNLPLYSVDRNDRGVPLVRHPIEVARSVSKWQTRCLINADIILFGKFTDAVRIVCNQFDQFLIISRRYRVDIDYRIDILSPKWEARLLEEVKMRGKIGHGKAVDYFCYRGNFWGDVPEFAVGRTSWDNWLVWKALHERVPVIDISNFVMCVHQNHYKRRNSDETKENRALLGDAAVAGFADVSWQMNEDGSLVEL